MYYLADTMALVWYLRGRRRFGKQAREILREADQVFLNKSRAKKARKTSSERISL